MTVLLLLLYHCLSSKILLFPPYYDVAAKTLEELNIKSNSKLMLVGTKIQGLIHALKLFVLQLEVMQVTSALEEAGKKPIVEGDRSIFM